MSLVANVSHVTLAKFDAHIRLNELTPEEAPSADTSSAKKLPVNQQHLKKAWETSQRSTKDDWAEWIRRLSVELLKESPSHALRACASLAAVYYPLARELFNAAFISCWTELYDQFQVSYTSRLPGLPSWINELKNPQCSG
jgi:FKBP12-rapamycin complex-associated protein